MASIIAVANQKGGVGKTTTSCALASGLTRRGYKVLAIDLDPQGNLSESLGAQNIQCMTMLNLFRGEDDVSSAIQHLKNCDIIPANITLSGTERELNETGREYKLKKILNTVKDNYDYIIIDTAPSLGILTINAFTAANKILIPSTASIFAALGIKQLSETISKVKEYCNEGIEVSGILITRFNPRSRINKDLREVINQYIHAPIYNTFIRNSVVVEEAQASKKDIYDYSVDSTVAVDYEKFIEEFLKGE